MDRIRRFERHDVGSIPTEGTKEKSKTVLVTYLDDTGKLKPWINMED